MGKQGERNGAQSASDHAKLSVISTADRRY